MVGGAEVVAEATITLGCVGATVEEVVVALVFVKGEGDEK